MKLHLIAVAAALVGVGSMGMAAPAQAQASGPVTQCVPVKMDRVTTHQRCTVTFTNADGSTSTSVYWIDQNGQWYLPAD